VGTEVPKFPGFPAAGGCVGVVYGSLNPSPLSHYHKSGKYAGYTWYTKVFLQVVEGWSRQRWYVCFIGDSAVTWLSDHINHSTASYVSLLIVGYLLFSEFKDPKTPEPVSVRHLQWLRHMYRADKK
jgi:hypothetical protein